MSKLKRPLMAAKNISMNRKPLGKKRSKRDYYQLLERKQLEVSWIFRERFDIRKIPPGVCRYRLTCFQFLKSRTVCALAFSASEIYQA